MTDAGAAERGEHEERFLVIDGRRWRRSDPSIPDALRSELVHELMDARRARPVARPRVQDAKVALGERGRPWWEPHDEGALRVRAAATMRALLHKRGEGKTICPSDVARVIGGDRWRSLMPLVRDVAEHLEDVELRRKGERGPSRIAQASR